MNRFYLRPNKSPTYYNLAKFLQEIGWRPTKIPLFSNFSEKNLDYNIGISNQLEYKHLLAKLVQQYCQENIMPKTYCIHDSNWQETLSKIEKNQTDINSIWILKPALLNNGQNICIFDNLQAIKLHYLSSNRMGGEHVLQKYITSPHLLKGPTDQGHKYSLRVFMVLTNYGGAFLYPHGYFNIAINPYNQENYDDLTCHITNEHLHEDKANVIQIPTYKYELFQPIYPKIKKILSELILGLQKANPTIFTNQDKKRQIALFGVDFVVDSDQKVWLIEANHGPCFPIEPDHDLQKSLYEGFWRQVVENFVRSIGQNIPVDMIKYDVFERL